MRTEVGLATDIGDGITQMRLPMTGTPMRHVNSYLIEDDDGPTLVDCGWKADDVLEALRAGLRSRGLTPEAIRRVAITHHHFDHYGLAGTLVRAGVPDLAMHERDWDVAREHLGDPAAFDAESDRWLERNGYPVEPSAADDFYAQRTELTEPTRLLADGERLGRLRAVWTPGHTPGHLCFVDERSGRMLTGDHVLDPVTPHVGIWVDGRGDPLGDYLASLNKVAAGGLSRALPAHGEPFDDLGRRVQELLAHHERRERQVLDALATGEAHAAAIAQRLPWTRRKTPFDELGEWHQQFAVSETLAHLEHLRARGEITRETRGDRLVYARA
jgi:glyoxylase-like metal-dependent hydrolase (beta-lactamase superfamily II)